MKKVFTFGKNEYIVYSDGKVYSIQKGRFLPEHSNGKGYFGVNLFDGKKQKRFYVHRLVCICFLENKNKYSDVNHKDGDKRNNSLENLEWVTRKENMVHAHNNCLFKKEKMENNHFGWVGQKINKRLIISVLNEQKNGNYKVLIRCDCGSELIMYYNDFKKAKHTYCRKCKKEEDEL